MERRNLIQAVCLLICMANTMALYAQPMRINFQPPGEIPEGYLPDYGDVFGDRGNGFSYGWDKKRSGIFFNRHSSSFADLRYDTLVSFGQIDVITWEIALENGVYDLLIACSDLRNPYRDNALDVEGVNLTHSAYADTPGQRKAAVTVLDGRLTVKSQSYTWFHLCFVDIEAHVPHGHVRVPFPEDFAEDVSPDVLLRWTPAQAGQTYNLYLGESFEDVNEATVPTAHGLDVNSFDPGRLKLGQTYYWRVDEVNCHETRLVNTGPVWCFTTRSSIVIEDFEQYNNRSPNRPFQTWLDGFGYAADKFFPEAYYGNGTGSGIGHDTWNLGYPERTPSMEEEITVSGSSQSMPLYYDLSGANIAQTDRFFDPPQDWTADGCQTLLLHFYGKKENSAADLYALINGEKVVYPDNEDLTRALWHRWPIDLTQLETNLETVTSLSVGVEGSAEHSRWGMLLLDDILLLPETPVPIEATDPGTDALVAMYTLDGHALDLSGHGHHGQVRGEPTYESALFDKGLRFDGSTDQYVDLGSFDPSEGTGEFTVSMWVKRKGYTSTHQCVMGKRDVFSDQDMMWQIEVNQNSGAISLTNAEEHVFATTPELPYRTWPSPTWARGWGHMAVTYDGNIARLYVYGLEAGSGPFAMGQATDAALILGAGGPNGENPFHGVIDEVAIYSRALSLGEIRYLAGDR